MATCTASASVAFLSPSSSSSPASLPRCICFPSPPSFTSLKLSFPSFLLKHKCPSRPRAPFISASFQKLSETESVPLSGPDSDPSSLPSAPGIYAVYNREGHLQFVGLTRRISASLSGHVRDLPELCDTVKFSVVDAPERAALQDAWKQWMEEHIEQTGKVPPGNQTGVTTWTVKKARQSKQDIWLTPGPNVKLTISLDQLIDKVVKENKVVAFIKGSRTAPQCGFSYRVLTILNENGVDYETLDVLDEKHNHGLREALKAYSQWPTIPQVFAHGEFIGGADIMDELVTSGKIKEVFSKA